HAFFAADIDDALAVAGDDVFVRHADLLDQGDAGESRSASAVHDDLDVGQFAAGEFTGVEETSGRDNGGAMLIVVENGNVELVTQAALDDEALWAFDVFEIDAAKSRADVAHRN